MDFLFHNSDYYEIPKNIKETKEGPFKFPEEFTLPTQSRILSMNPKNESHLGEHHLGENSTAQKLKDAIKSAKKSRCKFNNSDYYGNYSKKFGKTFR